MEGLKWGNDELLDLWFGYDAGIEELDDVSPEDKPENARSTAKIDAGAGNENAADLIKHGLGIQLHEDVAETEKNGLQIPAKVKPATENAVQVPEETDKVSEDKGGVSVDSAAPENPMTLEEIITKWMAGIIHEDAPSFSVDDRNPQEPDMSPDEQGWGQGWARNRRATGVPRQIPNYRYFDYRTGTYSDSKPK